MTCVCDSGTKNAELLLLSRWRTDPGSVFVLVAERRDIAKNRSPWFIEQWALT